MGRSTVKTITFAVLLTAALAVSAFAIFKMNKTTKFERIDLGSVETKTQAEIISDLLKNPTFLKRIKVLKQLPGPTPGQTSRYASPMQYRPLDEQVRIKKAEDLVDAYLKATRLKKTLKHQREWLVCALHIFDYNSFNRDLSGDIVVTDPRSDAELFNIMEISLKPTNQPTMMHQFMKVRTIVIRGFRLTYDPRPHFLFLFPECEKIDISDD